MVSLTDRQLAAVIDVGASVAGLRRIAAMLAVRGRGHYSDADVTDVATLALAGLAQQPVA